MSEVKKTSSYKIWHKQAHTQNTDMCTCTSLFGDFKNKYNLKDKIEGISLMEISLAF